MSVEIKKENFTSHLLFDLPIQYDDCITIYPVKMNNIFKFRLLQMAITVRKDSIFQRKDVIKMGYLDFIKDSALHPENYQSTELPLLKSYYSIIVESLTYLCSDGATIEYHPKTLDLYINKEYITNEIFD